MLVFRSRFPKIFLLYIRTSDENFACNFRDDYSRTEISEQGISTTKHDCSHYTNNVGFHKTDALGDEILIYDPLRNLIQYSASLTQRHVINHSGWT
jgi:hypothetical protein